MEKPTEEQLAQWLYDAEYDWDSDDNEADLPKDTFPHYYEKSYSPTLAAIFRELIEHRAKRSTELENP